MRFYEHELTKSVCKSVCKTPKSLIYNQYRGDGRTRTAVQTTHKAAFYTLILPLVVGERLPEDGLPLTYPLRLDGDSEELPRASGFNDTPEPGHNRLKARRDTRRPAALADSIKLSDLVD